MEMSNKNECVLTCLALSRECELLVFRQRLHAQSDLSAGQNLNIICVACQKAEKLAKRELIICRISERSNRAAWHLSREASISSHIHSLVVSLWRNPIDFFEWPIKAAIETPRSFLAFRTGFARLGPNRLCLSL